MSMAESLKLVVKTTESGLAVPDGCQEGHRCRAGFDGFHEMAHFALDVVTSLSQPDRSA